MDVRKSIWTKLSVGFYLFVISALLSIVGTAMFLRSVVISQGKFYSNWNGLVVFLVVLSIVVCILAGFMEVRLSQRNWCMIVRDILSICSTLCLALVLIFILFDTAEEIGVFYFSSLDSSNQAVISAMGIFVPAMILEVVALLFSMAGQFFQLTKTES